MINKIINDIIQLNGRVFEVGGSVRDRLLGIESEDLDLEIFGLTIEELEIIISKYTKTNLVGRNFGIIKSKINGRNIDFSLPRRESKVGVGHKGFKTYIDKNITTKIASSRRDFTINSMMYDLKTQEIIDHYNGKEDLMTVTLRATSDRFVEDPLRVLRAMQLCGRFNLKADKETLEMSRGLKTEYPFLSQDRIREEWMKWALKSDKPSMGLEFLIDSGWSEFYPEIHNNIGIKQNPKYHAEIFVHVHTQYVCDEAVMIAKREDLNDQDRLTLVFSALLHDCAKYNTSVGEYPNIRSPMHAEVGAPMSRVFLERLGMSEELIKRIYKLVKNHMRHYNELSAKAVRKLSEDMEPSNIQMLCYLIEADYRGREATSSGLPENARRILELSKQENVMNGKPKALLSGRHLVNLGLSPGPLFGEIVKLVYQKQLDGELCSLDEALNFVKEEYVL